MILPDDRKRNVVLDGGAQCTDADEVADAHARFVAAGAQITLTATFHALPHLRKDWEVVADRAVALAREGAGAASVWALIGPASQGTVRWSEAGFAEREALTSGWWALAARCAAAGVDGFALQTFTDAIECAAAVAAVRAVVPQLPIAASLSPRADGHLMDGSDPAPALLALRAAGATWAGFNCGGGPEAIEAAVALAPEADWARPSAGTVDHDALVAALVRLAGRCRYVGGCCGVDPAAIGALHRAVSGPPR